MVKNTPANVGDLRHGFNPWVGNIPGGGHGNPLQDSCLENPTDNGAWRVTVHEVTKESDMTEQISTAHHTGKEEMLQHIHDA